MFCNLLIDIACAVKPQLTIMDAILGMEGDGPGNGGTPRKTNLILSSTDPFALDNIASNIMGLGEDNNPVLSEAKKRKISGAFIENIDLLGGLLSELKIIDFKLPLAARREIKSNIITNTIKRFALNSLNPYPKIDRKKCRGYSCKACKKICPQTAISDSARDKNALIFDYNKCSRCFCCSEVCPNGAIENKYTFLGNIMVNKYGLGGQKF
jgi:ferredoxin